MNHFCEEKCDRSSHDVKTLPLKNLDFRVNFYFEEFLIFTVQMHGNHMEIFRKAFLQISNILFEILALIHNITHGSNDTKTTENDHQKLKRLLEILIESQKMNVFLLKMNFENEIFVRFTQQKSCVSFNFGNCALSGLLPIIIDLLGFGNFEIQLLDDKDDNMTVCKTQNIFEYLDFFIMIDSHLEYNFYLKDPNSLEIKQLEMLWEKIITFERKKCDNILKINVNDCLTLKFGGKRGIEVMLREGYIFLIGIFLPLMSFLSKLPEGIVRKTYYSGRFIIQNIFELLSLFDFINSNGLPFYELKIDFQANQKITHKNYKTIWKKISQLKTKENKTYFEDINIDKIRVNFENFKIEKQKIRIFVDRTCSFENFVEIWTFLNEIPSEQIEKIGTQNIFIISKNLDFLWFLDSIVNSSIFHELTFIFSAPINFTARESKQIWKKIDSLPIKNKIQIYFEDILHICNPKITFLPNRKKLSLEIFLRIWNILEGIPTNQIKTDSIIITSNDTEFLKTLELVSNSKIPINCKFNVSHPNYTGDSDEDCLDLIKILKSINSLGNKQRIQIDFENSSSSLSIIPNNNNQWEIFLNKCQSDFFLSIIPVLKEFKIIFKSSISFDDVKTFQEFYPKFIAIAHFPFKIFEIFLDYENDFSFENYKCIWDFMNLKLSSIEEIVFDFWSFQHDTMKIDLKTFFDCNLPIFELLNFLSPKRIIMNLNNFDYFTCDQTLNFSSKSVYLEFSDYSWVTNQPNKFFSSFQQLKELTLIFSSNSIGSIDLNDLQILIPALINNMLINNQNLEVLKIKVEYPTFLSKILFSHQSLQNLLVLEMDLPHYEKSIAKIDEQFPFDNNLISLKFIGDKAVIIENSNFLEKFPFLTTLIFGNRKATHVSKYVQTRFRFVATGISLKRRLRKTFRKEIIEEILMKIY